jgi:hypothetical protein
MYYKEKLINGVLMCQKSRSADWVQVCIKEMSRRCIANAACQYVAVPKDLLVKLEEARVGMYNCASLDGNSLLAYTAIMWQIANTKWEEV